MEYNIHETTGLTFGEFLRMDMESVITIYLNAKAMAMKKAEQVDNATQALAELENKKQKEK